MHQMVATQFLQVQEKLSKKIVKIINVKIDNIFFFLILKKKFYSNFRATFDVLKFHFNHSTKCLETKFAWTVHL